VPIAWAAAEFGRLCTASVTRRTTRVPLGRQWLESNPIFSTVAAGCLVRSK
jgi:hypothetical protein